MHGNEAIIRKTDILDLSETSVERGGTVVLVTVRYFFKNQGGMIMRRKTCLATLTMAAMVAVFWPVCGSSGEKADNSQTAVSGETTARRQRTEKERFRFCNGSQYVAYVERK